MVNIKMVFDIETCLAKVFGRKLEIGSFAIGAVCICHGERICGHRPVTKEWLLSFKKVGVDGWGVIPLHICSFLFRVFSSKFFFFTDYFLCRFSMSNLSSDYYVFSTSFVCLSSKRKPILDDQICLFT